MFCQLFSLSDCAIFTVLANESTRSKQEAEIKTLIRKLNFQTTSQTSFENNVGRMMHAG